MKKFFILISIIFFVFTNGYSATEIEETDLVLRVNCWSKDDPMSGSGEDKYFIIDMNKNIVERFWQVGKGGPMEKKVFEIIEINEKKVTYQAKFDQDGNPSPNGKLWLYEFYYGGITDHNGFGYPIYMLKPEVRKPHLGCSNEYHSIKILSETD